MNCPKTFKVQKVVNYRYDGRKRKSLRKKGKDISEKLFAEMPFSYRQIKERKFRESRDFEGDAYTRTRSKYAKYLDKKEQIDT